MVWESIGSVFGILVHKRVWILILTYMIVHLALLKIVAKYSLRNGFKRGSILRFVLQLVIDSSLGVILGMIMTFLLPTFLGVSVTFGGFQLLTVLWRTAVTIGITTAIIFSVLRYVPVVGQAVANLAGIQIFLQGIIIFRVICHGIVKEVMPGTINVENVYPGFLESIGFLILAVIFVGGTRRVLTLLSDVIKDMTVAELIHDIFIPLLGILAGLITMLMYVAYVRLSLIHKIIGK